MQTISSGALAINPGRAKARKEDIDSADAEDVNSVWSEAACITGFIFAPEASQLCTGSRGNVNFNRDKPDKRSRLPEHQAPIFYLDKQ